MATPATFSTNPPTDISPVPPGWVTVDRPLQAQKKYIKIRYLGRLEGVPQGAPGITSKL